MSPPTVSPASTRSRLAALGYGRRQIGAAVAGEALTQTLLAAPLSIPLGVLIASPLSQRIAEAWFEIGLDPEPPSFLLVIGPALALALPAAVRATRRALRLNIAATVRPRSVSNAESALEATPTPR